MPVMVIQDARLKGRFGKHKSLMDILQTRWMRWDGGVDEDYDDDYCYDNTFMSSHWNT